MSAFLRQTRTLRAAGLALAVAAGSAVFVLGSTAHAAAPPWHNISDDNYDPNAVGTLAFYDATGTQVFSGSTDDQPFAAYVAGSDVLRAGDTKAALFAYLPDPDTAAAGWTGGQLSAGSTYPDGAAPGALATAAPLQAGTNLDTTLADFITGHPNPSTATGYSGIYELRLRTSGEGRTATATYDVADIQVTGNTWQIVYPAHFLDSSTSLEVAPNTGVHAGDTVTLTATVTPSDATGKVKFKDGTHTIATVALSAATASTTAKLSTAGTHALTATYLPASDSTYGQSVGSASQHVSKATSTTVASWPGGKLHYGTSFPVTVTVTAPHLTPTGTVSIQYKGKTVVSGSLSGGAKKLTVPGTALPPGADQLTAVYSSSADVAGSSSAAKKLTIGKAVSKTSNTVAPKSVSKTKHATLTVHVSAPGTTPTGSVTVFDGHKKIATGPLHGGKAAITLPKLSKGKHSIHAEYAGSSKVAGSSAASVTLTVTA